MFSSLGVALGGPTEVREPTRGARAAVVVLLCQRVPAHGPPTARKRNTSNPNTKKSSLLGTMCIATSKKVPYY